LAAHDVVNQTVRAQHILFTADGVQIYPVQLRFAYPSELDLMARLSGMQRRERYGGWDRSPFTAASRLLLGARIDKSGGIILKPPEASSAGP
jgi:hypothetical protein